jgi:hypothetical protein
MIFEHSLAQYIRSATPYMKVSCLDVLIAPRAAAVSIERSDISSTLSELLRPVATAGPDLYYRRERSDGVKRLIIRNSPREIQCSTGTLTIGVNRRNIEKATKVHSLGFSFIHNLIVEFLVPIHALARLFLSTLSLDFRIISQRAVADDAPAMNQKIEAIV